MAGGGDSCRAYARVCVCVGGGGQQCSHITRWFRPGRGGGHHAEAGDTDILVVLILGLPVHSL